MVVNIILFLIICISGYVNWNLFIKIEKLEDANDEATDWILGYSNSLEQILIKIQDLDSKNLFESDDEVGSVFNAIKETIESLEELKNND
jgi:hypothetical protein|tara:strand:- start:3182 stop:3451 length:270 start_codon:yes stop_codon:yes gene_type:complete